MRTVKVTIPECFCSPEQWKKWSRDPMLVVKAACEGKDI